MTQRWTLLFSIVFALASFAHAEEPDQVIAPVIQNGALKDEAHLGVFTSDITTQPLNSLDIIRNQLRSLQNKEHIQAEKDGFLLNTTKRFTPESLTFFVAIGAVTFNSMWIKSHGDPLAMERHILSLKDPIAHLSFYSFMVANGSYINLRTKTMDPHTKAQMMRRLSYQGMAVGSLASSVISDIGHSAKMCVDQWLLGRQDEASVQSCNEAWKNWTARNKFVQYFPQIISMWVSQYVTEVADSGVKYGFEKVTSSSLAQKILNKQWLVKQAYKVSGADIAMTFTGGTWAIRGIKLVGKITQFSLFVGVDHFLAQYTLRPLNTLIQPLFMDFDAVSINKYWAAYDDGDWDDKKVVQPAATCISPPVLTLMNYRKCFDSSFEKEIEDYTKHMQSWRENLNSDVETDLAGWMEMTKKILNQFDYAYQFYHQFTSTLFETLNSGYRIQNQEATAEIFKNKSNFPFRALPLYGVSVGDIQLLGGQVNDLYLNRPFEIEQRQFEHIQSVLKENESVNVQLSAPARKKYNDVIAQLKSTELHIVAAGLIQLKNPFSNEISSPAAQFNSGVHAELNSAFAKLRQKIGDSRPVVYPFAGFTQAFAANSPMEVSASEAGFSLWSIAQKYRFNKESDLMFYKAICGHDNASFDKSQILGINMMMPQFAPPSLLVKNSSRDEFCQSVRTTNNMYSTTIGGKNLQDYVLANLNYAAIGDYRNKANANQFEKWWLTNAKAPVTKEFATYDKQFGTLVQLAEDNIFDTKKGYKKYADYINQSQYLKGNLQAQFKSETEFYLQLIQRALTVKTKKPVAQDKMGYRNYLLQTVISSEKEALFGLNDVTYIQVQNASKLMAEYPNFIKNSNSTNFDQYIAHSKKIDGAINDLLVLAGFKKVETTASQMQSDDLTAAPSFTGTETTETRYTDLEVKNPNLRQRVILAAVKGLRQVESENRRFIRMKIMLSKSLEVDMKEFMSDWNSALKAPKSTNSKAASPRG